MVVYGVLNSSSMDNEQIDLGFDWLVFHLTSHAYWQVHFTAFFHKTSLYQAMMRAKNNQQC